MVRFPARHEQQRRRLTVRLTARGTIAAAAIVLAAVVAGCGHSTADGRAAAARSRAQVVPAARDLYQTLFNASAQSVTVLDGAYLPCGTGKTKLYYSITLRLFPFTGRRDTNFDAYRNRVVSLVRGDGWTLRQRPVLRRRWRRGEPPEPPGYLSVAMAEHVAVPFPFVTTAHIQRPTSRRLSRFTHCGRAIS